jgi:hypothetical protein
MTEHADTREYLVVHRSLRVTLDRFVDATDRIDVALLATVLGPRWALFARSLHHHHESEDSEFFPAIVRARADTSTLIQRLEREHRELVTRLDAADAAVAALQHSPGEAAKRSVHDAIAAVRAELFPHLDIEDEQLLPAAAESVRQTEWRRISDHALRTLPKKDLPVVAGALDEVARSLPPDQRPSPPPLFVRVLLTLSWRKRYKRFVDPLVS